MACLVLQSTDVVEQLHAFVFVDAVSSQSGTAPRPRAIVLDVPSQQFYVVMWSDNSDADPITETSLKAIVEDLKNEKLPFVQFEP